MSSNGITLKGGNIKAGQAARDVFQRELKLSDVSRRFLQTLKADTPVVTGRLQASWKVLTGEQWGANNSLQIVINNVAPYANRVNARGRSAGYADRGIAEGRDKVLAELGINLGNVVKQLWNKDAPNK